MKAARKIFILSLLMLCCAVSALHAAVRSRANASTPVPVVPDIPYGVIEEDGVHFYLHDNGILRAVTTLPKTYFVLLTGEHNAEFYTAVYFDLNGYVRKSDVSRVDFEPVTKFANGGLTVTADVTGINIRATPDHINGQVLGDLQRGATAVYYGTLAGSSPISGANEWFFIKTTLAGETVFGYVYAPYVTATPIPDNVIEKVLHIPENGGGSFEPPNPEWPPYLTYVFVACLSIPAFLVMLLLFKKPEKRNKVPRGF
ncbi:MAG: hypothetical protein FWH03_01265 [Firmicutes bacterium]|nr:hypothetical protein [Bacillota bacterium]